MTDEERRILNNLITAAEEITCTLDKPEGWVLGWHEGIELDRAVREAKKLA